MQYRAVAAVSTGKDAAPSVAADGNEGDASSRPCCHVGSADLPAAAPHTSGVCSRSAPDTAPELSLDTPPTLGQGIHRPSASAHWPGGLSRRVNSAANGNIGAGDDNSADSLASQYWQILLLTSLLDPLNSTAGPAGASYKRITPQACIGAEALSPGGTLAPIN